MTFCVQYIDIRPYRYYHSIQVFKIAVYLNERNNWGLDEDILKIIALMHDVKKHKKNHAEKAAKEMKEIIKQNSRFEVKDKDIILNAIRNHNNDIDVNNDNYAKVIQDADKLSKLHEYFEADLRVEKLNKYKRKEKKILEVIMMNRTEFNFSESFNLVTEVIITKREGNL